MENEFPDAFFFFFNGVGSTLVRNVGFNRNNYPSQILCLRSYETDPGLSTCSL